MKKSEMKGKSKAELVRRYCVKFPNTSTRMLSKKIAEEHPEMFSTAEKARSFVRYVRGANGAKNRTAVRLLYELLDTDLEIESFSPEPIEILDTKCLILSDIHFPFHSIRALDIALREGKRQKVDTILLNGDIVDCYQFSSFNRIPDVAVFKEERKTAYAFLLYLRKVFKKQRIIWKNGNHDDRVLKYICQHAPAIWDEEYFSWQEMLHLDDFDVEYVKSNQWVKLGKLVVLHGHEFGDVGHFGSASSVNPARGLFLKTKYCCACGHHHQTSQHNEPTVERELITTWSIGCLCNLKPIYKPITKWNYGFAICSVDKKGMFKFKNYRILDNFELVD